MRRSLVVLVCLLLVSSAHAAEKPSPPPPSLSIVIRPDLGSESPHLSIELRFAGDEDGSTEIALPSEWAGEKNLYACVRNLEVVARGARLTDSADPAVKTISHPPGAALRVRYDLVQDFDGAPQAGRGAGYRPVVQPGYFQFVGNTALVMPAWDQRTAVAVSIDWTGLPAGATIADSFGANDRRQRFRSLLEDLHRAIYVGGDFRVVSTRVRGNPVQVALRGSWSFTDREITDLVGEIVGVERTFWRDDEYPYYLVTIIPLEGPEGAKSIGGTGLHDSFATFLTKNATVRDLAWLFAHEYFHNWNDAKLGRLAEPEAQLYWFSEGFTDYYTYVLLFRAGRISFDELVQHVNDVLREYSVSPARNVPNSRVIDEFFTNEAVSKQPYWRGALLAMTWDARIRQQSGGKASLDDVMRQMLARGRAEPERTITAEVIDAEIRSYLGTSILPDVDRVIVKGETLEPADGILGPCVERVLVEVPAFELGIDLDALKTKKIIAGVVPNSAAEKAGLRDGQTIVSRKPIYMNDPTHDVEITVAVEGGQRTVVYKPVKEHGPQAWSFRVMEGAPSCAGRFATAERSRKGDGGRAAEPKATRRRHPES